MRLHGPRPDGKNGEEKRRSSNIGQLDVLGDRLRWDWAIYTDVPHAISIGRSRFCQNPSQSTTDNIQKDRGAMIAHNGSCH